MIQTGISMSKGVGQPKEARRAATLAGINWMEAVFRTMSRHISSVAVSPCFIRWAALAGSRGARNPAQDNRADPMDVAKVVYKAATDGTHHWRYTVASEDFINWRNAMTDDEWYALQVKNYMGEQ